MNKPTEPATIACDAAGAAERQDQGSTDSRLSDTKAALFDALAAHDVRTVTLHFDGYGDSGQTESIEIDSSKPHAELLDSRLGDALPLADGSAVEGCDMTIREALEELAYGFLDETYSGWPNNDGAFGEFIFDVAQRSITLGYNERFVGSEYFEHRF
ncbi:DUF6878 family protein [Methylosinus sp. Sm6]|uniref:DUF6878 family protein n=1 Tax=Methylosinus sp. Sm6 TaxID=2866948 RepID=UPI001C99D26B|nr:DUF6878 family protein [Methylosinus sp. Sm6]MBY6240067.1 hypothetical protein [Methylosinus sp. Sm6]